MDPGLYSDQSSYVGGRTTMDLDFLGAAAGAVGALGNHQGVSSVAHGATGVYTVTFLQTAYKLLNVIAKIVQATYSAAGACQVQITADNTGVAATHAVTLLVTNAAGAAVDLATGDKVMLTFDFQVYTA